MLTVELDSRTGGFMGKGMIRSLAVFTIFAATACTAERSFAPAAPSSSVASAASFAPPQLPLLYIVDGVRLERDQVPSLTADQIQAVRVVKGTAALRQYGPDASYGAVVITTRQSARGS